MGTSEHRQSGRCRWRAVFWPCLLAATVFFASGQGQVAAPSVPGIDKVAHFLVFGLFGTLAARVVYRPGRERQTMVLAVLVVAAYGAMDEFRQSFTPGRAVELADWIADVSGALVAAALYIYVPWWRRLLEWVPLRRGGRAAPGEPEVACTLTRPESLKSLSS